MPGQPRILTVAISTLLVASVVSPLQAAPPAWACRTAADGVSWECFKDGIPAARPTPSGPAAPVREVVTPTVTAKPVAPAVKPQESPVTPVAKPAPVSAPGDAVKPAVAAQKPLRATPAAVATETAGQASVARIDRGLDWNQCGLPRQRPAVRSKGTPPEDERTYINADAAEISRNDEVGVFTGNVEMIRGERLLGADEVHYNNKSDVVDAAGNVYYQDPTLRIQGAKARFNLAEDRGELELAEYRLPTAMARGTARQAELLNKNQAHFEDIEYTTCRPGDNSWVLRARTLNTDQESGRGEATHARIALGGVPLFYAPYFSFPIDDRRQSGLLAPSFGTSEELGADISMPYYLNLAPNYDATITPRIMSRRGLMLAGEFRYLGKEHRATVTGEIIPDDNDAPGNLNSTRGAFSIKERGRLAKNMLLDVDINHVSDEEYLDDFGGSLAVSSARQLERRADVTYSGRGWSALARLQHFQSTDSTLAAASEAYRRLPQLRFSLNRPDQLFGLTYHLDAEYVQFDHATKVEGQRYDLLGGLSMPMTSSWGFLTPKITARYTAYSLSNEAAGATDDPDRFIPTLSIDGGLFFDRETNWFGNALVQTLEPRAYYLAIPKKNQDDQPDFDTSRYEISFPNLFRENRFNGPDRVGDANQLTLALTSRIIEEATGKELLRTSVGSILYFRDRKVQLNRTRINEDDTTSEIVAEASARLADAWSGRVTGQWDPHRSGDNTSKAALQLHYRDQDRRIFNISHRYNRDTSEQTDISTRWPVTRRLSLVGRWYYSLLHNRTMEGFGGFEYDSCCYVVRVVGRRYVNELESDSANNAIFVQLELKGLSSFGSDIVSLLDRGIFGYAYDD